MKRTLLTSTLILLISCVQAQINIKQSDLLNFSIGKDIQKHEPQNIRYQDGKPLASGDYVVLMDREGRRSQGMKSMFHVNEAGKIDGEMNFDLPDPTFNVKALYKNDTLVRIDKKRNGKLIETSYFKNDIFYEKEFESNGDFKREARYRKGEMIYSKGMNLSGWDVQDELKGTRTFYYGKTNKIESRTTSKNLEKDATFMEEKFDEKGILISKEIKYANGKRKRINKDGSYEIATPTNGGDQVSQYSSKGKLLKTFMAAYPATSVQ